MTVEQLVVICQAYELIQSGNRHCGKINEAYKLIETGQKKKLTRNKKIEAIEKYFNTIADETLAELLINKYNKENITLLLDGEQSGETKTINTR